MGLSRSDGKRPDGMSIVPWSSGRLLVWDATCPDTLAASYRGQATAEAGKVAAAAEDRKANKYIHLDPAYLFIPLAFETLGVFGPKTLAFVRELGRRISQETGEVRETSFLMQRLSIAVQRGNSAAVLGSCRHP